MFEAKVTTYSHDYCDKCKSFTRSGNPVVDLYSSTRGDGKNLIRLCHYCLTKIAEQMLKDTAV